MRTQKKYAAVAIAAIILLAECFYPAAAGDTLYADVPFEALYLQTEARTELVSVNKLRAENAWYWNADNKNKTVLGQHRTNSH